MAISGICGVIITTERMAAMAEFYGTALGLRLKKEQHGGLEVHYGMDLANRVHFALHPPQDFKQDVAGQASVKIAFTVDDLAIHAERLAERGHLPFIAPHDEGFGPVAAFRDPDGNLIELVELKYDFE